MLHGVMLISCTRVCSENEQLAFSPGIVVPGIAYSEDKLLQTRIFSYSDTQRYRLGGNYLQLPVNMPKCPHHNNHHDGLMNTVQRAEEVNYFPSRNDPARHAQPYPINAKHLSGQRERRMISKENNFQQVRSETVVNHAFDTRGTCLLSCWTPAPNHTDLHAGCRLQSFCMSRPSAWLPDLHVFLRVPPWRRWRRPDVRLACRSACASAAWRRRGRTD